MKAQRIATAGLWFVPAVLFIVIFSSFLSGDRVLLSTDAIIRSADQSLSDACRAIVPYWKTHPLLGFGKGGGTSLGNLTKGLSPNGIIWNNLVHGMACLAASCIYLVWARKKQIAKAASLIGLIVAFWVGSNFTLLYAGHPHKSFIVWLFICSLLPVALAAAGSVAAALVWGGCVGLMFAQQPDVALFFSLAASAYFVFRLWKEQGLPSTSLRTGKPLLVWLKVLVPAAVVAFLFAGGPLLGGYKTHVKGAAQMQTENKQAKWDYVTQWSFPPEEMIAFVAPGYTGWRSGEPEGPYWGRMGRSAGWEQTRQGFQNFKLENTYLGFIPVAFALFALFSSRRSKHKAEILFWGGATLVALLLAFGKFTPLYALFYKLPVVNNIRNPNKFLQVFQVCLAILTAYGADRLLGQKSEIKRQKSEGMDSDLRSLTSENRNFFYFLAGALGLLILWALSLTMNNGSDISSFVRQGWPQDAAQVIAANKMKALWHASFMAAVITAVFAIFSFPLFACPERSRWGKALRYKNWIAAGLVLIVAADAIKLSKHYVKEMPRSYIEANALTDFLKKDLGHQRVALLSQQGIYGLWTTYLLPYNKIPTFNFSDMPRMASDYKAFLEAGQRDPLNMWRFSGVKYLLGPTAAEKQLAGQARKVFAYDLASAPGNGFQVIARPTGAHAVFELLNTSPRYAVVAPVGQLSDEQALVSVAKPPRALVGTAVVQFYRPGKVKLLVMTEAPAMLRVAEKWDADWKATIDGEPAEVERVDYICQGVSVPVGEHHVELRYAPSKLFFYMQCIGYLILFGSLITILLRRKERHVAD